MKTFSRKVVFMTLIIAFAFVLASCGSKQKYYKYTVNLDPAFNSPNSVEFWVWQEDDGSKFEALAEELNDTLIDLDNKFNIQAVRNGVATGVVTDLMKINSNAGKEPVVVDEEVIDVIKLAIQISEETLVDGVAVYDITISPIWQLWDFPSKTYSVLEGNFETIPTDAKIKELLPLVDYKKIIIDEEKSTVYLSEVGMGIDLGSIVKGYAADKLKQVLLKHGIKKAVIDVGRNILIVGDYYDKENDYEDKPFDASIVTPYVSFFTDNYDDVQVFGKFKISDDTLVTSGTYEKYIKVEAGDEYHHILDPRTGYPFNNNVVSISVITNDSIRGDAYSTALFSLGIEKGMELVNSKEDLETVWVVKNGEKYDVYISSGLEGNFEFNQAVTELGFVYKGVYK